MNKVQKLFLFTILSLLFMPMGNYLVYAQNASNDFNIKEIIVRQILIDQTVNVDKNKDQKVYFITSHAGKKNIKVTKELNSRTQIRTTYKDTIEQVSDIAEQYVIGADNRILIQDTKTYPSRTVVAISARFPNNKQNEVNICSGVLIDEDSVLTAGHCIFSNELGGWADYVDVTPAKNGNQAPFGSERSTNYYTGFNHDKNIDTDFAIINLRSNKFKQLGNMGVFATNNQSIYFDKYYKSQGYPGDKSNNGISYMYETPSRKIPKDYLYKTNLVQSNILVTNELDIYKGQSGSPVFANLGQSCQVCVAGVISYYGEFNGKGHTGIKRFTKSNLKQINVWRKRSYLAGKKSAK